MRIKFVHCHDCGVETTPSGRRARITEPPTGDRKAVEALHTMMLAARGAIPVPGSAREANVSAIHKALGIRDRGARGA